MPDAGNTPTTDEESHAGGGREVFAASSASGKQIALAGLFIFLAALGVRLLTWHDTRLEVGKVQWSVTAGYKRVAHLLLEGGASSFFSPASPLADPDTLGHPPGYSILLAILFALGGESDVAVQLVQIVSDAACAVIIFLIAARLLPQGVAVAAGLLSALAPQFAWNSVVLLPDTLAVLPVLLAIYLIVRTRERPRVFMFLLAGALVGVSCWLRANALLLAPFLAVAVWFLFGRGKRSWRFSLSLCAGMVLVVAPLTIRNALVFGRFIPLSLGAGQTFLEGIADYDSANRFGIPSTDLAITRQEAATYNRPDYAGTLFGPDGVERERARLRRGAAVVRAHPLWFAGVMVRRAASMLRLERARIVSRDPPVAARSLTATSATTPAWSQTPTELLSHQGALASMRATASLSTDTQILLLNGDDSKYGDQLVSAPVAVERNREYVFEIPYKIERGRMSIGVDGADGGGREYASTFVETMEGKTSDEQPAQTLRLPFVTGAGTERVRLTFANGASASPVIRIGAVNLYSPGAASFVWTRPLRALVRTTQKLFLTAVMLPLALFGIFLLARARLWYTLGILLVVPAYFFCVQSALHTEYRYVLVIHYFLFVFVAAAIYRATSFARLKVRGR